MWTWLQNEPGADAWSRALAVLVDAGVKGIVLLALAGLVALAMRRASAAARHLVWTLALCGLLLLPVLSLVVPKWQLPILPGPATPVERALPASREPVTPAVEPEWRETAPVETETPTQFPSSISPPAPVVSHPAPMPTPVPSAPGTSPRPVAYWVLVAWLAVALVILTPLLVGFAVVARLRWNAVPFTGDGLPELARSLVESLGLHRPVTLLCTGPEMMPMTSGLLRPVVFLPREAGDWPDDKLRAVLLHELAHVKRRECLTHAVARVAAAVHWFNPLAWLALRRLRIERERACDDVVLTAGARASAYADHLLEIARTMHAGTLASAAAITIAKKGQFEGRLLAILDATRNRGAATLGRLMVAAGVSVVLLLACSAVQLSASAARDAGGDGRKWRDKAYIFPGFDATEFTQFHYEFSQFPYGIGGDWEHYFKADRQGQPLDYAYFHRQLGPEDFRFQIRHLDGETVYVVGDCLQTRKGRRLVALDREGRRYVAEVAKDIPARVMFPASLLVVYNGSHGSASNLKGGIGPNDGNATSGFPGAVSEVEWEYLGRKDGGWRFEFTRRFPIDVPPDQPEKTQTTRKEEVYRGGTLTIFEDNHQWIGIEPADEPPLEEEARIVGRWRGGGSGDGTAMTFWSDHRWSASDSGGSTDSGRWSFLDGKYRLERENGELLPFDVYVNESGLRMVSQSEPDEVFALERDEPPETRPADGDSSYRGEAGGAADEVRSILSGLEAGPFDGEFELTDSARERLIHLLPGAADVLFAIVVADEEDFLTRRRAGGVLLRLWGELSRESIESFLDTHARAYVHARPQYPQGIVAYVGTGYHFPGGAGLWRRGRGLTIHTVTRQTLDGQPTREPFHYDGPSASAGGIAIEDLSRGRHTAHVSTEYEIAYQGRVIKGKVESGPVTFEVGPSSSPDLLAAPPDPELERQVRDSLGITEVNEQTRYASRFHVLDPWEPQTYWREHDGHEEVGLHVPLWQLTEPLPVDLSLDVEFHVEHTGEVLRGDPLVVLKNRKQGGHFYPNDTRAFTAGREGFVPLRIVLKPSRAQALSTLEVTQYYNGPPITSEVVRAKVDRYRESEANAVVLRLREMHMEVTGLKRSTASPEELKRILAGGINENEQVYLAIENMTALNPHTRRLGASSLAFPSGLPVEPALPFLVELLGDPDVALPTTPAGEAARALAAIGTPAIPPLVGALKHENPEVRQRAAYALNDMGSNEMRDAMTPLVAEPLIERLDDNDAQVREAAAHALHRFPDSRAVEPLIRALGDDQPDVRANAAMALGLNRDPRACAPLIQALRDDVERVRCEAAGALGRLSDTEAVEPLIQALKDEAANVRRDAAWSLAYLKDTRAIPALIVALGDDSRGVLNAATYGLGELKAEEAVEALIESMDAYSEHFKGPHPEMRRHAGDALKKITGLDYGEDSGQWRQWLQSRSSADRAAGPPPTLQQILEALGKRNGLYSGTPLRIEYSRVATDIADSPPRRTEHILEMQFRNFREVARIPDGPSIERLKVWHDRIEIGQSPEPFYGAETAGGATTPRLKYLAHDVQHPVEGTVSLCVNGAPSWVINHFREAAEAGNLTIRRESLDGIGCVTLSAGGTTLSLAPAYDWGVVRFNSVRGFEFERHDGFWLPTRIVHEFSHKTLGDPPFARYSEEIRIEEVRTGADYRSQGFWTIPEPENGDYVQVSYAAWDSNWDIVEGGIRELVAPRRVLDACRHEHGFFWSDDLSDSDRLIWEVSTHWREAGRIENALRIDQVHDDIWQTPLAFYDADEKRIVWANYTGSMVRFGALPAKQTLAIGAYEVVASFHPSATEIRVGQSVEVSFSLRNTGAKPFYLVIQGSQRGDRDDRYQFWAFDERDMPAAIKWTAAHFGGKMGALPRLAPGDTWGEPLDLSKWVVFDRPGVYTVRGRRVIQPVHKEGFPDGTEPRTPFLADFQIRVLP